MTCFHNNANTHADTKLKLLGEDTYGRVFEAFNTETKKAYTMKVFRSGLGYEAAGYEEIRVLLAPAANDEHDHNHCARIQPYFFCQSRVYVFNDLYGPSLRAMLRGRSPKLPNRASLLRNLLPPGADEGK
ncbi:hypothetical protein GQ44DRAFT_755245 [Phaeosphaeriaceae sp. PMI808]|nr:hypothetical protein GQ44DRAFT_755245 [Phaeosphaeriaceae sp. PMI808]